MTCFVCGKVLRAGIAIVFVAGGLFGGHEHVRPEATIVRHDDLGTHWPPAWTSLLRPDTYRANGSNTTLLALPFRVG